MRVLLVHLLCADEFYWHVNNADRIVAKENVLLLIAPGEAISGSRA